MSNSYFQFKRFTVQQEKTAMKVCTDACLFGAWVAKEIGDEKATIENILDIGAGTGLLSLMLAQKTNAVIEAVEVDEEAAQQAKENFEASPWKERLNVHHLSIQQFQEVTDQRYDVIISNPPFFQDSLRSDNEKKNLAKHVAGLSFDRLAAIVTNLLKETGAFYVLLSYVDFPLFEDAANKQNLFLQHQVNVRQTLLHTYFRTIGIFSKQLPAEVKHEEISIKQISNLYSKEFTDLLKGYYLYL